MGFVLSFIKIKGQPMGRQVCLTMPILILKKKFTKWKKYLHFYLIFYMCIYSTLCYLISKYLNILIYHKNRSSFRSVLFQGDYSIWQFCGTIFRWVSGSWTKPNLAAFKAQPKILLTKPFWLRFRQKIHLWKVLMLLRAFSKDHKVIYLNFNLFQSRFLLIPAAYRILFLCKLIQMKKLLFNWD